jgi:hypothetical protein
MKWLKRHYDEKVGRPTIHSYKDSIELLKPRIIEAITHYPNAIPNWDNSPRSGKNGLVLHDANPELWRLHLRDVLQSIENNPPEQRIFFLKSWNEWAEGNHLEPDLKFGSGFLDVLKQELCDQK